MSLGQRGSRQDRRARLSRNINRDGNTPGAQVFACGTDRSATHSLDSRVVRGEKRGGSVMVLANFLRSRACRYEYGKVGQVQVAGNGLPHCAHVAGEEMACL